MLRNVTFVVQIAYFRIRPNKRKEKKKFLLFKQFLSNFRYKKQLLAFFGATFEQLFEKFRATFWEISSNLWQALLLGVGGPVGVWGQTFGRWGSRGYGLNYRHYSYYC